MPSVMRVFCSRRFLLKILFSVGAHFREQKRPALKQEFENKSYLSVDSVFCRYFVSLFCVNE